VAEFPPSPSPQMNLSCTTLAPSHIHLTRIPDIAAPTCSIIASLSAGQTRSELCCPRCSYQHVVFETCFSVATPMPALPRTVVVTAVLGASVKTGKRWGAVAVQVAARPIRPAINSC